MRDSTLLFLVQKENGSPKDICLAMKKRGFGAGRYNGVGGKVEENESIETAVLREAEEEIGIRAEGLVKAGELTFIFPHNPNYDQLVHVYLTWCWSGEPVETEEMKPGWFSVDTIPYSSMWPDDVFWLPKVLAGEFVRAKFVFGEGDIILEQEINATTEEREPALVS